MELTPLSSFFKALGEPTRLRLLHLLNIEELSVGELVRIIEMPQSTVSRHLKFLKEQGLISDRHVGAATFYRTRLEADFGTGEADLRDAVRHMLSEDQLPPADRQSLARTLAAREIRSDHFFNRLGHRWDALRESAFGPTFHLEALVHLLPRELDVADLGTGTGFLLPLLGEHFRRVVAVDMSERMLELARDRVAETGLANIDFRLGELLDLPIQPAEIDLALAFLLLHHVDRIDVALEQIFTALRPGGRLLMVEIHPHHNERFRTHMGDRRPGLPPEHLEDLLARAGFNNFYRWDYPYTAHPEHELTPLPRLYGIVAHRPGG